VCESQHRKLLIGVEVTKRETRQLKGREREKMEKKRGEKVMGR